MLAVLVWTAGEWVRARSPQEIVLVTLLEAGAQDPQVAPQPAAAKPATTEPTPAPETPPEPPEPPKPRPALRVTQPEPLRPTPSRAPSLPAVPTPAAIPAAPPAESGNGAAATADGAAPSAVDVARVYGEGEVDRVAAPVGGIRRPEYPPRERMLGREGRVSLRVEIDAEGAVRAVTVARSGGAAFDASARRAVERTPFRAARLGERDVASTVTVNVSFELD